MKIPIAKTKLTDEEFKIISKPLKSGWLVQGEFVEEFEKRFSQYTGAKHSIAVTSCTTALHLSLSALNFKIDDEAIVPAFTWISSANVIEHLGGKVTFCDIDLKTFNMDINKIERLITPKTKAIVPVHLFGLAANMDEIIDLSKKHNLLVIEDAACGFGAKYKGKHVGTIGDTGCFSFHPRKAITTGEGGMITTNNDKLAEKLRSLRDHGALLSDFQRHHGAKPYLLTDHPYAGFNYRLTDIQGSIGLTQLGRGKRIINERRKIAANYMLQLGKLDFFQLPYENKDYYHGYQSFPCIYNFQNINMSNIQTINKNRNIFMENLQKDGVATRPATHAVHMLKYYRTKYGLQPQDYPNAWIANDCSLSFPLYNGLNARQQDYVIKSIISNLSCAE